MYTGLYKYNFFLWFSFYVSVFEKVPTFDNLFPPGRIKYFVKCKKNIVNFMKFTFHVYST